MRKAALSDYASSTPANLLDVDAPSYNPWFWQGIKHGDVVRAAQRQIGYLGKGYPVCYQGVIVRTGMTAPCKTRNITDGLSNTMAIGEKRLHTNLYEAGPPYDDIGWTDGWDPDIIRYTGYQPGPDNLGPDIENASTSESGGFGFQFGSAHPSVLNAVFADGHVAPIEYDIDLVVFNAMGNREDGLVVNP